MKRSAFLLLFAFFASLACAKGITKEQSPKFLKMGQDYKKSRITDSLKAEWAVKEYTNGDYRMKFWDTIYGVKPADGRSLYISLHGGGESPTPKLNDGQWSNQKRLYKPAEGVYFVPRSPTDTWNMWHQEYMDEFLRKTIAAAVLFQDVNPDKVYILGYSAGGDGLYQLAPRLPDLWAAAAMMAGHPGDAAAENLRDLPFAIYMGGKDAAYDRNKLAAEWGWKLDELQENDPQGYVHDVHIYDTCGHWMMRNDTIAVPWMAKFRRNLYPAKVVWTQDDVLRDNFYWLGIPDPALRKAGSNITARIEGQTVTIEHSDVPVVLVGLNDRLLDLDQPVTVVVDGKVISKKRYDRIGTGLSLNPSPYDIDPGYHVILKIELKTGKVYRN